MKKISSIVFLCFALTACAPENPVFKDGNHMPVHSERKFIGADMDDIRDTFGEPFVIRVEEPNQLWTYRKDGCITLFYFDKTQEVCHAEHRGDCPRLSQTVKE